MLYAFALIYGLSFSNTPVAGLFAPGFAYFILATDRHQVLERRNLLTMALFFGLGLSAYLYFPLRYLADPPFNYVGQYNGLGHFQKVDLTTWSGFWWLLSGGPFRGLMFSYSPSEVVMETLRYLHRLWGNFLAIGVVFGLLGIANAYKVKRETCLFLALLFLTNAVFFINYRVVDKHIMFLPTYLVWAIWVGWGYQALLEKLGEGQARGTRSWPGADALRHIRGTLEQHGPRARGAILEASQSLIPLTLFLAVALTALVVNFRYADVSHDWRARDIAEGILAEVQPGALVFGWWASAAPLHYLQLVERQRPDVTVVNRFFIDGQVLNQWIQREIDTRPIYSAEYDPALASRYAVIRIGQVYKIERPAASAGPFQH